MTVATTTSKSGPYAGAGTTGPFTVTFPFLETSHLLVVQTNAEGVETVLTLGAGYTVTGGGGSTGTVTTIVAVPSGETLTIARSVPATQEADYVDNDSFPAESHELALDKLTMICQQLKEEVDRSVKLPVSSTKDVDTLNAALIRVSESANNIDTVAGDRAAINTVAGISADVTIVAANVTDVTNFSDVWQGPKTSDPATRNDTTALQAGDLYFNTVSEKVRVYSGSVWEDTAPTATSITSTQISDSTATGRAVLTAADAAAARTAITAQQTLVSGTNIKTINGNSVLGSGNIQTAIITLGTAVASTSGTAIDFTGLPAGVKRLTVMFNGVSTSGTSRVLIRLGSAGTVEATGYVSIGGLLYGTTPTTVSDTTGFVVVQNQAEATRRGAVVITLVEGNSWVASGTICASEVAAQASTVSGSKTLAAALDRIRITTVGGTDTFDAGTVNISWEV